MTRFLPIVLVLVSAAAPAVAQELERRPYLQMPAPDGMTIAWRTNAESAGEVRYGTDPSNLDRVAASEPGTEHAVRLTDLEPSTTYWYEVWAGVVVLATVAQSDARGVPLHRFTTPPPVGAAEPFRAWVVGDNGNGNARQAQVIEAMLDHVGTRRPDVFLHVGDMAYNDGTDAEFTSRFFAPQAEVLTNTPVWPALGNHEGHSSQSDQEEGPYFEAYHLPRAAEAGGLASGTEAYYSFDHGDVHFVVLDSHHSDRTPGSPMLQWLEADLAATERSWIVSYFHHPPYTKGSHDSDREIAHIEMREHVTPILEAGGVDLVLGGHSHTYERSYLVDGGYETPTTAQAILDPGDGRVLGDGPYRKDFGAANDGAVYVVAGHGGQTPRASGEHPLMAFTETINGSVLLDFEPDRVTITNVRLDGVVSDTAVLVKGESLVVGAPDGGEQFRPGARATARWASTPPVDRVDLEFSCDDGATWTTLMKDVPGDGSQRFIVPEVETRAARLRVVATDGSGLDDMSNAPFYVGRVGPFEDIPWGSEWAYWDRPEAPPTGWSAVDFDDSGWQRGRGEFGYGDGDETTELASRPLHAGDYLRHRFTISDTVTAAWLTVRFDDGLALLVDGELVVELNVADGIGHDIGASAASVDNEQVEISLPVELFGPGEHVLAAIVKQRDGSDDLSFDASLSFTFGTSAARPCGAEPVGNDGPSTCSTGSASAAGGLLLGLLLVGRVRRRS